MHNNKFSYPNSASISSLFNAEYFQSVPSRSFDAKLLKVKVHNICQAPSYSTLLMLLDIESFLVSLDFPFKNPC